MASRPSRIKQPGSSSFQRLLQRRDPLALGVLIEIVRPKISRAAARELDSDLRAKVDTEDVVQETFVELTKGFPQMRSQTRGQFYRYVLTLLRNRLEDVRRRFRRSQSRSVRNERSIDSAELKYGPSLADSRFDPAAALIDDELCDRTRLVLRRLPSELRRLLRLRFLKQMSWLEMEEKTGRDRNLLRMRVDRCLKRIQREIFPDASSST